MPPPDDLLGPSGEPRIARFGFDPAADAVALAAQIGRRRWDPCLWSDGGSFVCSLTRDRPARFFPMQAVGHGGTPAAALADAILRLCDPDGDADLDEAVVRAVRHRAARYPDWQPPAAPRPRRHRDAPPAPGAEPGAPVAGFAYRPLRASEGRTGDGWYPAGEVLDAPAGERLRVWMRPGGRSRVRVERLAGGGGG